MTLAERGIMIGVIAQTKEEATRLLEESGGKSNKRVFFYKVPEDKMAEYLAKLHELRSDCPKCGYPRETK